MDIDGLIRFIETEDFYEDIVDDVDYDNYYIYTMGEVRNQIKKIDFNNLTYFYKGNTALINFISFKGPLHIFKNIYDGNTTLKDVEKKQKSLQAKLGEISTGNPKNR